MSHPLSPLFNRYKIKLASQSPRRQELLKGLGIPFEVVENRYEEPDHLDVPAVELAETMAKNKIQQFKANLQVGELYLCADTVVVLEEAGRDIPLGKASSHAEALEMLMRLSGKWQSVYTGVALLGVGIDLHFSGRTKLKFRDYSEAEARYYLEQYRPFDKAGAYGIQEWFGMALLEKMEGSFYNVMGLPTEKLYQRLRNLNI